MVALDSCLPAHNAGWLERRAPRCRLLQARRLGVCGHGGLGCQRRRSQRPASLYEISGLSDIKNTEKESTPYTLAIILFFLAHFLQKGSRSFLFDISSTKHLYATFLFLFFLLKKWLKKYNQTPYW